MFKESATNAATLAFNLPKVYHKTIVNVRK